jgi:uncharacterized protein YggE
MTKNGLIFLVTIFISKLVNCQTTSPENRIIVFGEAEISVVANRVEFQIYIETIDSINVENCYKEHAEKIKKITKIFKTFKIPDKDITYTLLSVSYSNSDQSKTKLFNCSQNIKFISDSIGQITKFQEALINSDFEYFDSKLTAINSDKNRQLLLEKAIFVSREKANTLATASGRKLGKIVKIMESDDVDPTFTNYHYRGGKPSQDFKFDTNGLNEIEQTVTYTTTVKVIYELE